MAALTGKIAIVTASSRGIGRAIALRLGQDGAAVADKIYRLMAVFCSAISEYMAMQTEAGDQQ
jgi:NAD(P)-dependent dehydrogenase (short-subunit alcohol dehydrogenase family)